MSFRTRTTWIRERSSRQRDRAGQRIRSRSGNVISERRGKDVTNVAVAVNGVVERRELTAGIAEDMAHAVLLEAADKHISARQRGHWQMVSMVSIQEEVVETILTFSMQAIVGRKVME